MKTLATKISVCATALLTALTLRAQGTASFTANFDTGVPAGMTLEQSARVQSGFLVLTDGAVGETGVATVNDIAPGKEIRSFTLSYSASVFGSSFLQTQFADGYSVSLVPSSLTIPSPWAAEDGLTQGLSISFDTYNNGGSEAPAVEVRWNGAVIGTVARQVALPVDHPLLAALPVVIRMDADGTLDMTWAGQTLFANLATPYTPMHDAKWVLGGRTGSLTVRQWFDNLSIAAEVADVVKFSSDFSTPPSGLTLGGHAEIADGYLKLTRNAPGQNGVAIIDAFPVGQDVQSFDATFRAAAFGGGFTPADGFSFNLLAANGVLPANWSPENGVPAGLSVGFDTFDNGGGEGPAVDVFWNGTVIHHASFQLSARTFLPFTESYMRSVRIRLDQFGKLLVQHNGVTLVDNLQVPYTPIFGAKFVFGARTGGLFDNHFIDDLNIQASFGQKIIRGKVLAGTQGMPNVQVTAALGPVDSIGQMVIPDIGASESVLPISGGGTLTFVKVNVSITHTFAGDLELTLIHPDGTEVRLKDSSVGDDSANLVASFPDGLATVGNLATLNGKAIAGNWKLRVRDAFSGDFGRLNGWSLSLGLPSATTDAQGNYAFTGLGAGTYTLNAVRSGFVFTPTSRTLALGDGQVDFNLVTGYVAGKVTSQGSPMPGVVVQSGDRSALTDQLGDYRLILPAGSHNVSATLAGYSFQPALKAVALGDEDVNFAVDGYPISGRVTDLLGGAVSGVTVSAPPQSAQTDANGLYTISSVPAGARTITPTLSLASFTPPNRAINLIAAATGMDFVVSSSPPRITDIANLTIAKGTVAGPIRFTVTDAETRGGFLRVTAASGHPSLVPTSGINLEGVGNDRTITLTPDATMSGSALITVTVTDEAGLTASDTFTVRVNAAPLPGIGSALAFNGVDAFVQVESSVLDDKGNFTVEAWVTSSVAGAPMTLLAQGTASANFTFEVDAAGSISISDWSTGIAFPFGGWHHIAVVKEASNARLYIDGQLRVSRGSALTMPADTDAFFMGRGLTTGFWKGAIDELRVWKSARTGVEIARNMNTRSASSDARLAALWHFDGPDGYSLTEWRANPSVIGMGVTRIQSGAVLSRYEIFEDEAFLDLLQAYDPDNDPLTFTLVSPAALGAMNLDDAATGQISFAPQRNVSGADQFTFKVSDGFATTEVAVVVLDILPDSHPPTITPVGPQTTAEDTITDLIRFTVGDYEEQVTRLTMTASSSVPELIATDGFVFVGAGASRTLRITPAANKYGSATITVTVSDGRLTTSTEFALTVTPVNDLPTIVMNTSQKVVTPGQIVGPLTITVDDVDDLASTLALTGSSDNNSIISLMSFGGGGNNRTLTVVTSPTDFIGGTANITVTLDDGEATSTATFQIYANNPPSFDGVSATRTYRNQTIGVFLSAMDVGGNPSLLEFSAVSSDQKIVRDEDITFNKGGTIGGFPFARQSGTLNVPPVTDAIGTTTITVTVTDGYYTDTVDFQLTVADRAEYTFVELPRLQGSDTSTPLDINDAGHVVGYATMPGGAERAILWDLNGPQIKVSSLFTASSAALAINDAGRIVGVKENVGFSYFNGVSTALAGGAGNTSGLDINTVGQIIGAANTVNDTLFFLDGAVQSSLVGTFETGELAGHRNLPRLSDSGDVFGYGPGGLLMWIANTDGTRTVRTVTGFSPGGSVSVGGINNSGQIVVNSFGSTTDPIIYNYRANSTVANLTGALQAGLSGSRFFFARAINDSAEVIGATHDGIPWVYTTDGDGFRVQAFVDQTVFKPETANAISSAGDIVGVGTKPGVGGKRPYILKREVIIGQPQTPPPGAINPATQKVYQQPLVESLDGLSVDELASATLWGAVEQKLYFLRPMTARVTWLTTSDLADPNPSAAIVRTMRAVWPKNPQLHVAGAPVDAEPISTSSPFRAVGLSYSTIVGAGFNPANKRFTADQPGYSVLRYLIAPATPLGSTPPPTAFPNHFLVVRTFAWDDRAIFSDAFPAIVGTKVMDPRGQRGFKTGWVINEIAPYDGAGSDRAYNRSTQTGPIIPVNRDTDSPNDDLVVAHYGLNKFTSTLWPDSSVRYNIQWPTDATELVIANPAGSGPLPTTTYRDKRIYNQPDRSLPGFNPNEEHALFAPVAGAEEGLFALRNDLNTLSAPFVLLKYRDASSEWRIKPFAVKLVNATHKFTFTGEAGKEIQPPYPLSLMMLCPDVTRVAEGKAFKDHRGKLYALHGPTLQVPNPRVVLEYGYPMQSAFYYDVNGDGSSDAVAGACIKWNGIYAGTTIEPVKVTYNIVWPADVPVLQIGETLMSSKRGLPEVRSFAAAQMVFDTRNPNGDSALSTAARLYDPISARTLRLEDVPGIPAGYQFPSEVALQNRNGKMIFTDLAYHLRSRLSYDPVNRAISFKGELNEDVLGEPLLLINVLSPQERDAIKRLSGQGTFHTIIDALYNLTRNPNRVDADKNGSPDTELLIGFTMDQSGNVILESLAGLPKALTAGLPMTGAVSGDTDYVVIAENNNSALGALPVTLHVIRVDDGPFRGDLKIIFPDNVFDERLTVRHSSDFGGDPSRLEFEWWYHSDDANFDPTALPLTNPLTGQITDPRGWRVYKPGTFGQNFVTIGEGGESSLFTLTDNWFITRYRGYEIDGAKKWSSFVGDPSSATLTRAAFAPGWIKRVVEGINPFEARSTNFHEDPSNTYASMLIQAGERYEGDIALNPSAENLNSVGLIQVYSTVLNRGRNLSIDGLPPIDSDPANNALLLAASRVSDFYTLLGNEAFSDAQDPTIGFFSDSLEFGTVATSIFAFQNQLDSLLEEELALLRGRDDSSSGVGAAPVYNRLLWNFTGAEGEVAYERVYNVGDVTLDGVINEQDARLLFPQGHGDAWGHYLTAIKTYYDLLRHPQFTWIPRSETVLIAGVAVKVDFLDERKFAAVAAAKAKAGAEIVDLTYRSKFVDNPQGQYQGYKDTKADRAWGVSEWASRAGQGAYFDWLSGNAVLPSTDPNPAHTGIQRIDRQTVVELDEVHAMHRQIQAQIDKVDLGLNPLGLAKGVVPFDIDPSKVVDIINLGGTTHGHFEQIYDRAVQAMNNTVTMWNQANSLTEALRRQQDTVDDFTANVADQERDFKNRLIEIFGYPYVGDIGPGQTYPSGYDGPDIYHYMYVGASELTGVSRVPEGLGKVTGYYKAFKDGDQGENFYFANDLSADSIPTGPVLAVEYPLARGGWSFEAPARFGSRRAPGELQLTISDLLQEETRLKQALKNHDNLIKNIEDAAKLLASHSQSGSNVVAFLRKNKTQQESLSQMIVQAKDAQLAFRRVADIITRVAEIIVDGVPKDIADALFPFDEVARAVVGGASIGLASVMEISGDVMEGQVNRHEAAKEATQLQTDIDIHLETEEYELTVQASELLAMIREEAAVRLECLTQAELVNQSFGRYQEVLARGERLLQERTVFRQRTAGFTQQNRYKDISFRIFRNDALQKYRAQFDLAARYVYLAGSAYDYELNFLGSDNRGARDFFTDIIRQRNLGVMVNGLPITGRTGLSDPLARLKQNYEVLAPRFGLNNPQQETARFSLRKELFRIRDESDSEWRRTLKKSIVPNLWDVPEFRRYCRPFAPESAGPQPGIVIRFPTTVTFGLNFFQYPLGGGDNAYDSSLFSTKVNKIGAWFSDYDGKGMATSPRIYLFPAGMDILRSPTGNSFATREWKILDQVIPAPFPVGVDDVADDNFIPMMDSLPESFAQIRRYASFRAFHDTGVYDDTLIKTDSRLIGRSVWNTEWILVIPGGALLNNADEGLQKFTDSVSDILLSLQSYSYSGD